MLNTDLIEPGTFLQAIHDNDMDGGFDADMLAGTVVEIGTTADAESGEISRSFLLARYFRGKVVWHRLAEPEVRQIKPPNSAVIKSLYQALAEQQAKRKGTLNSQDIQAHEAMSVLLKVQTGGWS